MSNNRKKAFEVYTRSSTYLFPYAVVRPTPNKKDKVIKSYIDPELGNEGFGYVLESGDEGTVHIDHVLEYNKDPSYMADQLLYKLTLQVQEAVEKSPLSTREIIRRLGTSPAQYYRLLDQTNYKKSVRQLLTLLHIVNYEVEVVPESDNVFEDLGFDLEEAANLKIRADLMLDLRAFIQDKGWTQAQTAAFLGETQPRISNLMKGEINRFSVDKLINMLAKAGMQVKVDVEPIVV